ncbi:MAG: hypothetical protein PHZ23_15135 [Acidiphilium sp.]|nr:hypothetical protein [Acidiphilium sp.]
MPKRDPNFPRITVFSFKHRLIKAGATIAGFCRVAGVTARTGQHYSGGTRRIPNWVGYVLDRIETDENVADLARRLSREPDADADIETAASEEDEVKPDPSAKKRRKARGKSGRPKAGAAAAKRVAAQPPPTAPAKTPRAKKSTAAISVPPASERLGKTKTTRAKRDKS